MIEIIKAKILKKGVEIGFTKTNQKTGKKSKTDYEDPENPHPDFIAAMQKIAPHAAILAEYKPLSSIHSDDKAEFKDFTVSGFTISHKGEDNEGVTITAMRTLRTGKKMLFNTPFISFNDEGENAYEHIDHLLHVIEKATGEAREFMNGKNAPDNQQEIEFPDDLGIKDKTKTVIKVLPGKGKGFLPPADPEAMKRVAEMGADNQTEKPKDKKGNGKKRVAQSANNPSGIIAED